MYRTVQELAFGYTQPMTSKSCTLVGAKIYRLGTTSNRHTLTLTFGPLAIHAGFANFRTTMLWVCQRLTFYDAVFRRPQEYSKAGSYGVCLWRKKICCRIVPTIHSTSAVNVLIHCPWILIVRELCIYSSCERIFECFTSDIVESLSRSC